MQIGLAFWIIMLLWLVFWGWGNWGGATGYWMHAHGVLLFILLFLLGYHVFGAPLHG